MLTSTVIAIIVIAVILLFLASRTIRIIPQSRVAIVQRLGRYHRTASPGITAVIPIVDKVLPLTDMREQVMDFPPQSVITADNVGMQISTVVYYRVIDAAKAQYEVANFKQAMEQITQTNLRNIVGNLVLDKTLTARDQINSELRAVLDGVTENWGVRVQRVELKEIIPPHDVQQAMEKQMQAERTRRAAILTAEGEKQSAILKAEGEKQSAVLRAEGEKQSAVLKAEGQAEAYRNVQKAEIEMAQRLFDTLSATPLSADSLRYLYLRTLPEMAKGSANKLFMVPSELGDLAGAISTLAGGASLATSDDGAQTPQQRTPQRPRVEVRPTEEQK